MDKEISEKEYNDARAVTSAYEAAQKASQEAARAAYAVPVKVLIESAAFRTVYDSLVDILANYSDDSYYGMPVGALHTISRNLANQVGINLDAPVDAPN